MILHHKLYSSQPTPVARRNQACVRCQPDHRRPVTVHASPIAVPSTTSMTTTPSSPEICFVAPDHTARAPPMLWPTNRVGTRLLLPPNMACQMPTMSAVIVCRCRCCGGEMWQKAAVGLRLIIFMSLGDCSMCSNHARSYAAPAGTKHAQCEDTWRWVSPHVCAIVMQCSLSINNSCDGTVSLDTTNPAGSDCERCTTCLTE